ncbi:MAG: VOC family protein [Gammaproteobacteria bacterium]|jgi:lactoylglutathione lyase|nr:VOC family protein [Gammaproteobacteria bacterium]MBT3867266.1 VOC family protein [Gammaproteobacteria bacterium]MBT4381397.1 VOC family protein [Gammaproteobacteria bacterium]MBT4617359.1 VOC family protein [Gammaproteobacteria bacterium]MBT5197657.1 VOC family protein [Gammaproteobacteria bacterium]
MKLAKNCIDVGVRTNNMQAMLEFWTMEVGLPYNELLKIGGGVHQHRLALKGSIFKLNHARSLLPENTPTGYRELLIASDVSETTPLTDPDGNKVTLVPVGLHDITNIGMKMVVRSLDDARRFFTKSVQAEPLSNTSFRWGTTVFLLEEDKAAPIGGGMQGAGYRYMTVQVFKVDNEHAEALERGALEGSAPVTLGTTARISFITDPDNNWIEISQRKSLTGDLSAE